MASSFLYDAASIIKIGNRFVALILSIQSITNMANKLRRNNSWDNAQRTAQQKLTPKNSADSKPVRSPKLPE